MYTLTVSASHTDPVIGEDVVGSQQVPVPPPLLPAQCKSAVCLILGPVFTDDMMSVSALCLLFTGTSV